MKRIKYLIRSGLALLLFSALLSMTVHGATLASLPVTGADRVQDPWAVDDIIAGIPDDVITLYRQKGGRIYIVNYRLDSMARRYGMYVDYVYGLYVYRSCNIYVYRETDRQCGAVLAHELGHFLFHETRPSWPADVRARYQDDEAFAELYSAHHTFHCLSPDDIDAICRLEAVTGKLIQ